jgi:hypothetical protein
MIGSSIVLKVDEPGLDNRVGKKQLMAYLGKSSLIDWFEKKDSQI